MPQCRQWLGGCIDFGMGSSIVLLTIVGPLCMPLPPNTTRVLQSLSSSTSSLPMSSSMQPPPLPPSRFAPPHVPHNYQGRLSLPLLFKARSLAQLHMIQAVHACGVAQLPREGTLCEVTLLHLTLVNDTVHPEYNRRSKY